MVVPRAGCAGVVGIAPDIALGGAVAMQIAYGVDGAVGAVQQGEAVFRLTVVQVLEPGQGTRAGGTVKQVGHLAGGKLVGGFGFRLGAGAVFHGDAFATGGVQPVAVGEGAAVLGAEAAHRAYAGDRTGAVAVGEEGLGAVDAADTARIPFAAGRDTAGVGAAGEGAGVVHAADAAHSVVARDVAEVGGVLEDA